MSESCAEEGDRDEPPKAFETEAAAMLGADRPAVDVVWMAGGSLETGRSALAPFFPDSSMGGRANTQTLPSSQPTANRIEGRRSLRAALECIEELVGAVDTELESLRRWPDAILVTRPLVSFIQLGKPRSSIPEDRSAPPLGMGTAPLP